MGRKELEELFSSVLTMDGAGACWLITLQEKGCI